MNSDQKQIDKAFYSDGYNFGMEAVSSGITQKSMFSALEKMHTAIDNLIDTLSDYAKKQGQLIDCKKGCEWCCYQPIFALSYEMEYLNDFVKNNFDNIIQNKIKAKAQQKNNKLKLLNDVDLLNSKHACPLLEKGACVAYEARPMACRIYLSTNVNTCLQFYKNPENEKSIPALLDFPLRAGRMMNEGFKAALKTGGLPSKEFRIEEILLVPPIQMSGSLQVEN